VRARHAKAPIVGPAMRRASTVAAALTLALALGASAASADSLPTLTTDPASEVGVTTAKLSGKVNPNGAPGDGPTSWRLEYSPQGQEAWSQANAGTIEAPASEEGSDVGVEAIFGFGGELQPGQAYEFRLVAENGAGSAQTPTPYPTFTMGAATAPTLTIGPASDVQHTTAHLEGTIDPEGGNENPIGGPLPINWSFQVSTDGGASWSDASGGQGEVSALEPEGGGPIPALGDDPITVEADVSGLTPNKGYEARLLARYANKEALSSSVSLTTLQITAPTVALDPIEIDGEAATLTGAVNPNGFDTGYWVEHREVGASDWVIFPSFEDIFGTNHPDPIPLGAGTSPVAITQSFHVEPKGAYEYRLGVRSLEGDSYEGPFSFTAPSLPPSVATGTVGSLTHNSARLTAYVDANNTPTTATFEYDTDPSFASPTVAPSSPGSDVTGNGSKVAYADVSGLEPGTTYYWRVKAQSAAGSDQAEAPRSFDTYAPPPEPGSCPNEAIREAQGSTHISNCRAWELVSRGTQTVDVEGADISRQGNRVLYRLIGGSDQTSSGAIGLVLSDRTPAGWEVSNPMPPRSVFGTYENPYILSSSSELNAFTISAGPGLSRQAPSQFYRYAPTAGGLFPGAVIAAPSPVRIGQVVVASDDQTHAYALLEFSDGAPFQPFQVYSLEDSTPKIVSLLPSGEVPGCAVSFSVSIEAHAVQNWVSDDGDRVFFQASTPCSTPRYLYMREGGAEGVTTLLAGPPVGGPDSEVRFVQATPSGDEIFFQTTARITGEDSNETADLYRHTIGVGNKCLTCAGPPADIFAPVVAQNGDRAYFFSRQVLAPGAVLGEVNLYVWRTGAPGDIAFVAPASGDWNPGGNTRDVIATPDGAVLVFPSSGPELNALTERSNGGTRQLYRYDDRNGALDCVTCPLPPAEATNDVSQGTLARTGITQIARYKSLIDDGRSLVFITAQALVEEDVNNSSDAYEWRDGRAELVSDGRTGRFHFYAYGYSADGRDLIFSLNTSLTPDGRDIGTNLYDARVNGGFPSLYESPRRPCAGDGCRKPQGPPPPDTAPSTPSFSGPGNVRARPPCAKRKMRRNGRCVRPHVRKQKVGKHKVRPNRGGSK
jgi:hypothetical protein